VGQFLFAFCPRGTNLINQRNSAATLAGCAMAKLAAGMLSFWFGVMCWTGAVADAFLVENSKDDLWLAINGEITEQDLAFVSSYSKDFEFKPPHILLDGPGGDVAAAMKIGRLIRSVEGETGFPSKRTVRAAARWSSSRE
jgi:hypothetical protein